MVGSPILIPTARRAWQADAPTAQPVLGAPPRLCSGVDARPVTLGVMGMFHALRRLAGTRLLFARVRAHACCLWEFTDSVALPPCVCFGEATWLWLRMQWIRIWDETNSSVN